MRKPLVFILLVAVLLGIFGCSVTGSTEKMIVKYDIELALVRKASDINQRYQAPVADTTMGNARYVYEDDLFRSIWSASESGWELTLYNKSEKTLTVDWDEAVYMDVDKIGRGVLVSTTKYSERNNPQTPTVIVRRGNITENLFSKDHVYQSSTGVWAKRPLFPIDFSEAQRYKGRTVSLILPFSVDGLTSQYEFVFNIKNVSEVPSTSNPWQIFLLDRALGVNF
ncbi:MAG: hypothetical protein PHQ78_00980 [Candidatus Cloacimonetes bacterium]|jgi:hypothetical protein|nr:hypothetical protein [Candidatus Cloacimonadota bacterium]MDD2505879.1 hypothetical protein [Candidatus Cloacimonadota bacterium]MDD4559290.1 hypothetical protein [Candidatus Cloacimonadota bacterium]